MTMPASLRVLHVGKFYPPYRGGMEVFLADLVTAQRSQGLDAAVLVHGTPESDDPAWLVRVPVQLNILYAPIALGFRSAMARAIRQFKPDVLHLHMPNNSALWVLTLPQARALPWVVHWHSDVVLSNIKWSVAAAYALYRPFEQAVLDGAERIIVTSQPYLEASEPLRRWRGKCAVVPLGLRTDLLPKMSPPPQASTADLEETSASVQWSPNAQLRLLSIGRLTYYKGFETLIEAVQQLPGVELLIAGEGELHGALQARIAVTGAHLAVPGTLPTRLLGSVSEARKHALLAGCDVFCLASRERTEAFGVVLLEAMHHARPCIVTDLPGSGMPWVVAQSRAGLCVPIEDVQAWRSTITRLQHDQALRRRLGNAGPDALARSFGIDACTRAVQRQYGSIVSTAAPQSTVYPGVNTQPVLIVLATHNRVHCIADLVRAIRAQGWPEVLVIDNRSTDGTCHAAQVAGARVVRPLLAQNHWSALQTGMRHALLRGYAGVVTLDASALSSASANASDIARLVAHAVRTQADMVLGVAAHTRRRPRLAAAWFRRLTGLALSDVGTSFRHYNRRALAVLASREATLLDYADLGALLLARRAGLCISELPLAVTSATVQTCKPAPPPQPAAFATWGGTVRYLAATTLLCMARWQLPSQRRNGH